MRKYTVQVTRPNGLPPVEHTYEGFNRDFSGLGPKCVALVFIEGEVETFALDDPLHVAGLVHYLSNDDFYRQGRLLGCYVRK